MFTVLNTRKLAQSTSFVRYRYISYLHLKNKKFLTLKGKSSQSFLQGLVTNDTENLKKSGQFMYSFMLNAQVSIKLCDDINVYAALSDNTENLNELSSWSLDNISQEDKKSILFYAPDPRAVPGWSGRTLCQKKYDPSLKFKNKEDELVHKYDSLRIRLGIPEGSNEVFLAQSFPLECNGDLNGGISFNKGCYVGQELTARTRFTGVIRGDKIMKLVDGKLTKKVVGKLVSSIETDGVLSEALASIRLSDAILQDGEALVCVNEENKLLAPLKVFLPGWWPESIEPKLPRINMKL